MLKREMQQKPAATPPVEVADFYVFKIGQSLSPTRTHCKIDFIMTVISHALWTPLQRHYCGDNGQYLASLSAAARLVWAIVGPSVGKRLMLTAVPIQALWFEGRGACPCCRMVC